MMKNKMSGWLAGGLLAVAVLGVSFSGNAVANASAGTEPWVVTNMRMQQEKSSRSDATKVQETQTPCGDTSAKTGTENTPGMMQGGKMNPDRMQSSDMQQSCEEMMKNADMQKMMQDMMKQPQMQAMMKQMMANDPGFKQMMMDMVNAGEAAPATTAAAPSEQEHNAHHAS